jgi:hypothetical protein
MSTHQSRRSSTARGTVVRTGCRRCCCPQRTKWPCPPSPAPNTPRRRPPVSRTANRTTKGFGCFTYLFIQVKKTIKLRHSKCGTRFDGEMSSRRPPNPCNPSDCPYRGTYTHAAKRSVHGPICPVAESPDSQLGVKRRGGKHTPAGRRSPS